MKVKNSQGESSARLDYTFFSSQSFPYSTLQEGAMILGINPQRLSRLLKILKVPVSRQGYTIFLDDEAIKRIRRAVENDEVKPGRKKVNTEDH